MLEAALLWCKKFRHGLEQEGFKFNPYDSCVANHENNGSQQTLLFHGEAGVLKTSQYSLQEC
jgi:hypothetical protein